MTHRSSMGVARAGLLLGLVVASACAHRPAAPGSPAVASLRAPAPAASSQGWVYEVLASGGGEELAIEAWFPPGTMDELTVVDGAEPYLKAVEADVGKGFAALPMRDQSWFLPTCTRGCRVRYRFALGAAARASGLVMMGRASAGAIESPPSTWLLRPVRAPLGTPFRFHVTTAPGDTFASGVFRAAASDTYQGKAAPTFQLPYAAIGKVRVHERLQGRLHVAVLPSAHPLRDEKAMLAWVERAANAVAGFYGRFPVPRLLVLVRPVEGDGVGFGTAIGNSGAAIAIDVGDACAATDFADDWVLVHEMIHTAMPDLNGPHHWLEEGLSTYVEPLARTRAGMVAETDVWRDWVKGMPNGLPRDGDEGLDVTHTWGRTYWGGALFCLVADVEIRSRTGNRKSIDDALRAVVEHGGNISEAWPITRVIEIGDAATGVPVLAELYAKMAHAPAPVDLPGIWRRLGVVTSARGEVTFDDAAPLANVRRAMTARPRPE